ncbi:MAG: ATP synthase subunit I [Candidatus Hydrogenedentes bacterium]|nr:ATP synthase subunit I [Candidatus Hydrogenedentota bacterium]
MTSFEQFKSRVVLHSVAAAILGSAVLGLVRVDYGLGFLLGAAASVLNLHLMAARTARMVEMSAQTAKGYAFRSAISRYVLLALALALAARLERVNFVCAACGIFLAQAVLVANHLLTSRSTALAVKGEQWKE